MLSTWVNDSCDGQIWELISPEGWVSIRVCSEWWKIDSSPGKDQIAGLFHMLKLGLSVHLPFQEGGTGGMCCDEQLQTGA